MILSDFDGIYLFVNGLVSRQLPSGKLVQPGKKKRKPKSKISRNRPNRKQSQPEGNRLP